MKQTKAEIFQYWIHTMLNFDYTAVTDACFAAFISTADCVSLNRKQQNQTITLQFL